MEVALGECTVKGNQRRKTKVLILFLVEVALGGVPRYRHRGLDANVLILFLVEVALGEKQQKQVWRRVYCLNPFFSGSCSWSFKVRFADANANN